MKLCLYEDKWKTRVPDRPLLHLVEQTLQTRDENLKKAQEMAPVLAEDWSDSMPPSYALTLPWSSAGDVRTWMATCDI